VAITALADADREWAGQITAAGIMLAA